MTWTLHLFVLWAVFFIFKLKIKLIVLLNYKKNKENPVPFYFVLLVVRSTFILC